MNHINHCLPVTPHPTFSSHPIMFLATCIFFFLVSSQCFALKDGYYWREYLGSIPSDALSVGIDKGEDIFIGQTYLRGAGIITGRINPTVKYLHVPYNDLVNVGKYVKILCGLPRNLYWMPANAISFHSQIVNKHPVIGGHDDLFNDYFTIGRAKIGDDIRVGKVASRPQRAFLYYSDDEVERVVLNYEVLMYRV